MGLKAFSPQLQTLGAVPIHAFGRRHHRHHFDLIPRPERGAFNGDIFAIPHNEKGHGEHYGVLSRSIPPEPLIGEYATRREAVRDLPKRRRHDARFG